MALLNRAGHNCSLCLSVTEGLDHLRRAGRTMTVLDARMPWSESAPFLHALESKGLPVLFLTSDPANADHLRALYQADSDAITEQCTDRELLEAIDRLLVTSPATHTLGDLTLNIETRHATCGRNEAVLTQQESALLEALMEASGAPVSREKLLRTAWGFQSMGATRTVDVHVQRLRRKLGNDLIETIYKTGYRLRLA